MIITKNTSTDLLLCVTILANKYHLEITLKREACIVPTMQMLWEFLLVAKYDGKKLNGNPIFPVSARARARSRAPLI